MTVADCIKIKTLYNRHAKTYRGQLVVTVPPEGGKPGRTYTRLVGDPRFDESEAFTDADSARTDYIAINRLP